MTEHTPVTGWDPIEREALAHAVVSPTPQEVDAIAAAVHARIDRTARSVRPRAPWGLPSSVRIGAWAFGIGVIVAMVWSAWTFTPLSSERPAAVYTTRTGQRAMVTLTDGSRVTLAPQTTLRVMAGFGTKTRTVVLRGEAYFEVLRTASAPLIVQTGKITTRVLGTAFSVRRYPTDHVTQVAIANGRVAVQTAHVGAGLPARLSSTSPLSMVLTKNMVATVTDSTIQTRVAEDIAQYTTWTHGYLVLRDAQTTDVLAALTRWYGYQFTLADSTLAGRHLNVWLSTQSSAEALATLKLALNVDLVFDGSIVTLRPRRAAPQALPSAPPVRTDHFSTLSVEAGR